MLERFPEIAFALALMPPQNPFQLFVDARGKINGVREGKKLYLDDIEREVKEWQKTLSLHNVDVLVIYGLGLGHYFPPLVPWLQDRPQRKVIFLEDDLAVIEACMRTECCNLFTHPQVYIQYPLTTVDWTHHLETMVHTYPGRHHFTTLSSYRNKGVEAKMELLLQRVSTFHEACLSDALHQPHLFKNFCAHAQHLPHAFFANRFRGRFKNIPAIICGAGPSLNLVIDTVKKIKERALIVAGGSTIAALSSEGVVPHLAVGCDPNPEEYRRLREAQIFENCVIATPRLYAPVWTLFNGSHGYLYSHRKEGIEQDFNSKWGLLEEGIGQDLSREACSVTTQAIALVTEMGCSPIIFVGMDLAFREGKSYAKGVETLNEEDKGIECDGVQTLPKWVKERDAIDAYMTKHPEVHWINCTEWGLGFTKVERRHLAEVLEEECRHEYDLPSLLWSEIERSKIAPGIEEKIGKTLREVKESLERMEQILEEIFSLDHDGKKIVLEMDLKEEMAFTYLFKDCENAFNYLCKGNLLEEKEKYKEYRAMIKSYLDTLK